MPASVASDTLCRGILGVAVVASISPSGVGNGSDCTQTPGVDQEKSVVSVWLCSMMPTVRGYTHIQPRGQTMPDEIITDLTQIQRATIAKENENVEFRTFVKLEVEVSERRLNRRLSETSSEFWKHADCLSCAACCLTPAPVCCRSEAQRIA